MKDVSECFQTHERCQKANRATGKKVGMMIQIQEPKYLWEIVHMDWVTALPPGGDRSYNACLVLVESLADRIVTPTLPFGTLNKDLVDIQPTESSFEFMLEKARNHPNRCVRDSFKYVKELWAKSHKRPDFKIGDLVLVSTFKLNNMNGPNKLGDSFSGPFIIKLLHGANAVQLEITGE
ncbi:hypothetical protein O181_077992 [Austropuccinia psidii MF-1]|uniref:Uncharacterized protein n=1 Tax=Austropuccinia psidii MF-1 TaxID=1389203 RepID=A0A9Q3FJL8_9BASI|nr:hypothetical protein [Austropuccinia psidii MF-1]